MKRKKKVKTESEREKEKEDNYLPYDADESQGTVGYARTYFPLHAYLMSVHWWPPPCPQTRTYMDDLPVTGVIACREMLVFLKIKLLVSVATRM